MIEVTNGTNRLKLFKSNRLVGLKGSLNSIKNQKLKKDKDLLSFGGFNLFELDTNLDKADQALDELRSMKEVDLGTHIYHTEKSNKPIIPTGLVIIHFDPLANKEERSIVLDEFGLQLEEQQEKHIVVALCTKQSANPIKVCNMLEQLSMVQSAEPDFDIPLETYEAFPIDQLLKDQWQFENTGSISFTRKKTKAGADAKIKKAWEFMGNTGSSDIRIALIDSGFDLQHGDFRGKVVAPYDISTGSSRLRTGIPMETHGTPCASIALANADASGLIGVAPKAHFIPVQKPSFAANDLKKMIKHCVNNGADIISASWGTIDPNFHLNDYKKSIIKWAATKGRNGKGCIILFAAGNEGVNKINNFGLMPEVIAIGATDSNDEHPSYSNTGRELSVCAPSDGDIPVLAAKASWDKSKSLKDYINGPSSFGHYKAFGGTSAATPLVAGVCALILSVNPELYAWEVKEILQNTADKVGDHKDYINGHSLIFGHGRINALKAVKEAQRRRDLSKSKTQSKTNPIKPTKVKNQIELNPPVIENGNWIIQLGVFSKQKSAERFSKELIKKHSIRILIDPVKGQERTLYRVSSQKFETRETAKIFLNALDQKGINGFIKKLD
ncbi:MAG: S8 family serine peptidase [Saprospiraceae bacterium]|nr:S8 family serine peptidase [Saprospiraceae bacterium]